jgi:hypothetical protein
MSTALEHLACLDPKDSPAWAALKASTIGGFAHFAKHPNLFYYLAAYLFVIVLVIWALPRGWWNSDASGVRVWGRIVAFSALFYVLSIMVFVFLTREKACQAKYDRVSLYMRGTRPGASQFLINAEKRIARAQKTV